jgi:hypothetical protein
MSERTHESTSFRALFHLLTRRALTIHLRQSAAGQRKDAQQRLYPLLDRAVWRLPENCRVPFILCLLEGRTIEEAATVLAWSQCLVRRRLRIGQRLLRRRLAACGVYASTALLCRVLRQDLGTGRLSDSQLSTIVQVATATAPSGTTHGVSQRVALLAAQVMCCV